MLAVQVFLLRKNWMGSMGDQIMVITTQGRKSGNYFSTPIGFLRDGNTILALTNGSQPSNWYRNLLANPRAILEIKGQQTYANAEQVKDPAEIEIIFSLYRSYRKENFQRYFGIPADSSDPTLKTAMNSRRFIRFYPISED